MNEVDYLVDSRHACHPIIPLVKICQTECVCAYMGVYERHLGHLINFTIGSILLLDGSFRHMSAALIADLCHHEVRWRGLSLSAGVATPRMRSKTTTNSAPWAAVTLSKQRPSPDHRTYLIKSSPPTAGRPQTTPAQFQMPPERRKTCIHAHAYTELERLCAKTAIPRSHRQANVYVH